jgi:ParB family chromosome partitioning protein
MAAKRKRGLDRGLDALLSESNPPAEEVSLDAGEEADTTQAVDGQLRQIPVEFMQRGRYQPRKDMSSEALEELAESIRTQGVMQPIVVRPLPGSNNYELIAGERRWRAAQMAGLESIPAIVREIPDETAIAMALIENIQREDLNPMEEAGALARLKEEFELTHQQVANAVGKSRAMVSNLLRLMSLEPDTRTLLEHGDLEMGHARCLLALEGTKQVEAARTVVNKGLSVRQAEELVRDFDKPKQSKKKDSTEEDPNVRQLVQDLSERIGAPVQVKQQSGGKGKLIISYNSLDELDGILGHIK